MQHLKVSGAVRPLKWSLGVKWLICHLFLEKPGGIFLSNFNTKTQYFSPLYHVLQMPRSSHPYTSLSFKILQGVI